MHAFRGLSRRILKYAGTVYDCISLCEQRHKIRSSGTPQIESHVPYRPKGFSVWVPTCTKHVMAVCRETGADSGPNQTGHANNNDAHGDLVRRR